MLLLRHLNGATFISCHLPLLQPTSPFEESLCNKQTTAQAFVKSHTGEIEIALKDYQAAQSLAPFQVVPPHHRNNPITERLFTNNQYLRNHFETAFGLNKEQGIIPIIPQPNTELLLPITPENNTIVRERFRTALPNYYGEEVTHLLETGRNPEDNLPAIPATPLLSKNDLTIEQIHEILTRADTETKRLVELSDIDRYTPAMRKLQEELPGTGQKVPELQKIIIRKLLKKAETALAAFQQPVHQLNSQPWFHPWINTDITGTTPLILNETGDLIAATERCPATPEKK
jgi:hypothetical protein